MREEFIFNKTTETIDAYMTKAAGWLRAMQGDIAGVDCSVLEGMSKAEEKELQEYVYMLAIEEMKKTAGRHGLHKCAFHGYEEDFISNFTMCILGKLHTFNDARYLAKRGKKYKFSTFLDELSKEAIRVTFSQMHGIPEYVEKQMQTVKKIRKQIAMELGISEMEVMPELIVKRSSRSLSVAEVISLLNLLTESVSVENMVEEDGAEKNWLAGTEDVQTSIFDVLEYDVQKVFDGFFSKLCDVEKFFVLVHVGCSELHGKMTLNQLSVDEMLLSIVKADSKFCKNIMEGQVVVERPDRRSVKDAERLVLEDVEYVNDSLIRYQRRKAENTLATLKGALKISDITGGCGVTYFTNQWEQLVRKYR